MIQSLENKRAMDLYGNRENVKANEKKRNVNRNNWSVLQMQNEHHVSNGFVTCSESIPFDDNCF